MAKGLVDGPYKKQALVPASPWLDHSAPPAPLVNAEAVGDSLKISWTHADEKDVFHWVAYFQYGKKWDYRILNRQENFITIPLSQASNTSPQALTRFMVTAVDRVGNESEKNLINR